jgi:hypothetical protein
LKIALRAAGISAALLLSSEAMAALTSERAPQRPQRLHEDHQDAFALTMLVSGAKRPYCARSARGRLFRDMSFLAVFV